LGISEQDIELFLNNYNKLPNLQLLEATSNFEKNDQAFDQWLSKYFTVPESYESYLMQNLISPSQSLMFTEFLTFFEQRKQNIKNRFMQMLDVKKTTHDLPLIEV